MKRIVIFLLIFNFQLTTFNFLSAQDVSKAFAEKEAIIGTQYTEGIQNVSNAEEQEALRFLYAYMPLADITDYSLDFHLQNVRASFQARKEMAWGKKVPDLLFRHFVLPVRVNNEALDSSRIVFFRELKERVKGMGMKEAILEVNHWCHERVTYAPSDGRTLSPLACIKNALGRCGEESTFTVAALRSIGIPARQVYTPRWAHTDDNHAWVEAWADGQWYFLGACEPEPVLNLGWFNAPASRAMLMHTRAFGDYRGPEEVMLRTSCFTEINLIDNYGSSARIDFRVVDERGKAVNDARVDFKIYNYAEFCTVATKYTDKKGRTFLTAGKGDMLVWASKDGKFGWRKASFGKDRNLTLIITPRLTPNRLSPNPSLLGRGADTNSSQEQIQTTPLANMSPSPFGEGLGVRPGQGVSLEVIDIVPPVERVLIPEVPEALKKENQRRLAYEDSLRHAYEATFSQEGGYLTTARGNWRTIKTFIESHRDQAERVNALLASLTDKDLRDMPLEILEDNLTAESDQLCPRVENEMIIHPYKNYLREEFKKCSPPFTGGEGSGIARMQQDPQLLVKWVKDNIRLNPDTRALRIAQTPVGVWQSRLTDSRSRDIFFVALARSLGIEARKDVVTNKVQYRPTPIPSLIGRGAGTSANERNNVTTPLANKFPSPFGEGVGVRPGHGGFWIDVDFEATEQVISPKGTLLLTYEPNKYVDDPKYYSHFTVTRITESGGTSLLNFEEGQLDMGGGTSWSNTFRDGTPLDVGTYLLTTGTRLANGSVLATNHLFTIEEGKTTTLPLILRHTDEEVSVIGSFDAETKYLPIPSGLSPNPSLIGRGADTSANERNNVTTPLATREGQGVSLLAQTGRGYYAIGLVGMGQEPTNHALRDICKVHEDFDEWSRPLLLLFESEDEAQKFKASDYGTLPKNTIFGIDTDGSIRQQIMTNMKLSNSQLPIFLIADTFNRVVFCSQGYTIGLGEQMQWTIKKL